MIRLTSVIFYSSISPQCEATITALFASPDVACLNPSGLVGVFTGGNVSVIPAVNTWLTGKSNSIMSFPCIDKLSFRILRS